MTIVPDSKDWTWVLNRVCPECGFDARAFERDQVPQLLRDNVAAWQRLLDEAPDPRRRPRPDKWSTVEYACHVRDVFRIYSHRLRLMLTEDDPLFPNWDQDATAIEERYSEQDPATVNEQLAKLGAVLAGGFAEVHDGEWERPGRRSDGAVFTVESFARYFLHDPVHHLWDVTGSPSPAAVSGSLSS